MNQFQRKENEVIPNRTITILNTDDLDGGASIVRATKYVITDPVLADIRNSLTGFKGEEFHVSVAIEVFPCAPTLAGSSEPPVEPTPEG